MAMATWYQKHQRSRAAVDAKQKAFVRNQVDRKHLRESSWESRSVVKVTKADINRRIARRKEMMMRTLQTRRHKLAQLLESESDAYSREIENTVETDAQRRMRLIAQAKELQKQREAARLEEVATIRATQFKDGLDEFRVLKSKAIKMQCHGGRAEQMQAREARRLVEEVEDVKIHKEYMKISAKMLEREIREANDLARKNAEMRQQVAVQVAEKRSIREAEVAEKELDVEQWREALHEMDRKEKAKNERIHAAKTANVKEMFRLNRINIQKVAEKEAMLQAEEAKMLRAALEAEKLEKLKEEAHTAERAAEAKRFQAFLKSRREFQEEDDSALREVLKAENERSWAAKEAVWEKNRQQKESLAAEVAVGMAEQVQRHRQDAVDEEARKQRVKIALAKKNARIDAKEEAKQARKQAEVDAYRASLRTDIVLKKVRRGEEAQLVEKEKREMAQLNQQFDANLKAVMGSNYVPPANYRRQKVQWYF